MYRSSTRPLLVLSHPYMLYKISNKWSEHSWIHHCKFFSYVLMAFFGHLMVLAIPNLINWECRKFNNALWIVLGPFVEPDGRSLSNVSCCLTLRNVQRITLQVVIYYTTKNKVPRLADGSIIFPYKKSCNMNNLKIKTIDGKSDARTKFFLSTFLFAFFYCKSCSFFLIHVVFRGRRDRYLFLLFSTTKSMVFFFFYNLGILQKLLSWGRG